MNINLAKLIRICLRKNRNFVVFSIPESNTFTVIIESDSEINPLKKGFVIHPFQESKSTPSVFIPADFEFSSNAISDANIEDIEALNTLPKVDDSSGNSPISKEKYLQDLTSGIDRLKTTDLQKFIFSRIKNNSKSTNLDLSKLLFKLNEKYPNAFSYLLHHQNTGIWMGATPETLLHWNKSKVSTMSLAGTLPNTGSNPEWNHKELEEQEYVTQYISNAFTQNNIEHKVGKPETVKAGPVYHLKSKITSTEPVSYSVAKNLIDSLHPTPAVCGIPLKMALETIATIEKHDRKYYTGYLGIVDPDKSLQLFVNLRCMQVLSNSLDLYVGGGITQLSSPLKEWEETNYKAKTLVDLLP